MPLEAMKGKTPGSAFRKHVEEMHPKGTAREDVSQAAARIVREATDKL